MSGAGASAGSLLQTSNRSIAPGDAEGTAEAVARCEVGAYLRSSAFEPRLMHFPASQEITDFLLARGEDISSRDHYGRTPIRLSVWHSRIDQISLLIARGGDISARDSSDQTPLFGVVERFPVSDVERMIEWGADPLADLRQGDADGLRAASALFYGRTACAAGHSPAALPRRARR